MDLHRSFTQSQKIARQLIQISRQLNQIVLDQQNLIADWSKDHIFKIDQNTHQISMCNDWFKIQFFEPNLKQNLKSLVRCQFEQPNLVSKSIQQFFLEELYFLTDGQSDQHSLLLREKAQQLKALLVQQIYQWVNGKERVHLFLTGMSLVQAEIIDQIMMRHDIYTRPYMVQYRQTQNIPKDIFEYVTHLFRVDIFENQNFFPIQALIEGLNDLCFGIKQFLPKTLYRMVNLIFKDRFSLKELLEVQSEIYLLYPYAKERSNLLGFIWLMNRDVWHRSDLLSKQHFLEQCPEIWQKKVVKLPLFDSARAVNWLFKQEPEVLDWLSENIQHSSVRVAVTAMSYVDCSHIHAQVILATLQYFQYVSARILILSCHHLAISEHWFEHPKNQEFILQGDYSGLTDQRIVITPSILYLDEWMGLMQNIAKENPLVIKRVYRGLYQVMQEFMLHLHRLVQSIPQDLIAFIRPETQQSRQFYLSLKDHKIQIHIFRDLFYLRSNHARESIFDSYVRDYLGEYFLNHQHMGKNMTWQSLFNQAVAWHDHIQKQEIIAKLKKEFSIAQWTKLTQQHVIFYKTWMFEELASLDRIIEESKIFHHCLAASYAQRIIEGEYVAFRMAHQEGDIQMTLGCYIREGQLLYDQLECPNNQKAELPHTDIAIDFIDWLNAQRKK